MAKVRISESGNPRLDGEFELDVGYFTNRELHWLKKEAAVRPAEVQDALLAADNDVAVVFAYIALHRAGVTVPIDVLWDMRAGKITLDFSDEEVVPDPPAQGPSGSDESDAARPQSSGVSSNVSSESQESDQSSTGIMDSETLSQALA